MNTVYTWYTSLFEHLKYGRGQHFRRFVVFLIFYINKIAYVEKIQFLLLHICSR